MRGKFPQLLVSALFAGVVISNGEEAAISRQVTHREFLKIAERLEQSDHPYLGTLQIERLSKQLKTNNDLAQQIRLRAQLGFHQLRLGDVEAAIITLDKAFTVCREQGTKPPVWLLKAQAMSHLRHAELTNCVRHHTPECCVFPLANGGVHPDKTPARKAHSLLLQILEREPQERLVQWLLHIAAMAMGEFPQSVPEAYRIPIQIFEKQSALGRFTDHAPRLGLDHFNLCGGVAVADFDGNGLVDILTSSFDPRAPLTYDRQINPGTFQPIKTLGLEVQLGGLNVISADYDNDGDADLFVLRGAWLGQSGCIRNSLLRNDGAAGFTDVTHQAGLAEPAFPTQTAVWGDFDIDGDLDLYIGNESLKELGHEDSDFPNQLFVNDGHGRFVDKAREAGVANDRFCKGVAAGDYDNDGDLDLYVSNAGKNRLYRNEGSLKFNDVAETLGVMEPSGRSFATWFFDYNNDGHLDLFVTAYQATPGDLLAGYRGESHRATFPKLYQNTGNGRFRDVTKAAGLEHVYLPMGANFGDVDYDGWLDIYLATGDPQYETLMPNVLLRNVNGRRFEDITFSTGLGHLQKGHGVAFVDIDQDGDQDIYHQLGGFYPGDKFHNALFLNPGHDNRFSLPRSPRHPIKSRRHRGQDHRNG